MADDVVRIIRIETGGSEQTVKGLKEEINSLRDALLNTEKGSEEYKNILNQLIEDQKKLTDVMRAGQKEATAAEGSYNALVNQMAALKKVWKETTDEVSRKELGNQINEINDKLKKMDASIGDYRRNVGNYAGSITEAFGSMGGAAKGMVGPLNNVKKAFTALSSHPLVFVLTTLAGLLINGIAKGFKSSEENTNKLRVAFSGFKAIGDAVLNLFQGLAGWIGKVAEAAMNFADKLGLITPKMKERQEMTRKQIELEKKERDSVLKTAQLETEAAELREKASDEENYSIEQRIGFLQQAVDKEVGQLELEKEILVQKAAQLEAQLALTQSSGAELDALNELKAKVVKINAQIAAAQRQSNKEMAALRRRGAQEATQERQQLLNLEKDLIQQELDLAEDGSDEQLRLAKELRKKELEIQQEGFKTKIKNRKDYEQAMKLSTEAYNRDIKNLENEHEHKRVDTDYENAKMRLSVYRKNSSQYWAEMKQIETDHLNDVIAAMNKTTDEKSRLEWKKQKIAIEESLKNISDALTQAEEQEVAMANQIILNGTRPMSAYYRKQFEQLKKYYDNMLQLQNESDDEFANRKNAAWKATIDALANLHQAVVDETGLYTKAMDVMYEQNASVLEKLSYKFDDYQGEWNQALIAVRNVVMADMDNIMEALTNRSEEFKRRFDGIMPNPETILGIFDIKDFTKMSKEELEKIKELFGMLIKDGLIPDNIVNNYLESLQGMVDTEKEILQERYDNWDNLTSGIVALTNNVADAYEADLKYAVEHNKKSEEVAKKEFDTIKALRISAAVVDTIQGAIATFMGWQDKGQPWGSIIGAVQAAATLAAGWAQIRQIQSTKFGSSGSGGSVMLAQAQVTPSMPDYNPQMTGNLTGEQETENLANAIAANPIRAFVVESDISAAQQVANQRTSESTF